VAHYVAADTAANLAVVDREPRPYLRQIDAPRHSFTGARRTTPASNTLPATIETAFKTAVIVAQNPRSIRSPLPALSTAASNTAVVLVMRQVVWRRNTISVSTPSRQYRGC